MSECSDAACTYPAVKRSMCNTHYQRWRMLTPEAERLPATALERFLGRVDQRGPDECWLWKGAVSDHGYGNLLINGRRVGAHRYAFIIANGYEPNQVDHTCHNGSGCEEGVGCRHRRCCNPSHLEDTSNLVNSLRGESFAARHARKTHCVNGHAFTPENTYLYSWRGSRPRRLCRACDKARREAKKNRKAA